MQKEVIAVRDKNITLENYCEKYVPLKMLEIIKESLSGGVLVAESRIQFNKQCLSILETMQENLVEDIGRGSIYENILDIN